ncbi:MAG: heme o synthase [Thermoplasmata archaeon]|uniref:Protoheme IX farnesyltransferase n=1 Tax=Candidatus Sysuiplasma superficiale TaxID=2823368 RepID=A0A8J7YSY3_9ARCH|nr:heme o synthase [Candidatus Sysuiplasma superficiale]MBX8644009.1 heme o synthase [Candidatus Sysuiplasma superficiale]
MITAELLLGVASLLVASGPSIRFTSLAYLVMAGYMGLGGSAAINSYLDRDIDALMPRTASRPIPSGRLKARNVLLFGCILIVASVLMSYLLINPVTAAIIGLGSFLYLVFYSILLKRRTPNAVIWGGLAGAIPAFGGWSVYTEGHLQVPLLIFMVVFFWQPSHFWNLSIYYREDYVTAGVPVGPAVKDLRYITEMSFIFNLATAATTYALYFITHLALEFLVAITVMNIALLVISAGGMSMKGREYYRRAFLFSVLYMFVFIICLAVSGLISPHSYLSSGFL